MFRQHIFRLTILLAMTIVLVAGCNVQDSELSVDEAWARPGLKGGNGAVFFTIKNVSGTDDRLLQARSEIASVVEIHKTNMVDGVMVMEKQPFVLIPSGEQIEFKPGDLHLMLIGLTDNLNAGDEFLVTLEFESIGEIDVLATVQEP